MAGKGSSMMFYPYLVAFNICWKNGIVELDEVSEPNISFSINASFCRTPFVNTETNLIKKDMAAKLSGDAKEILKLILDDSEESASLIKSNSRESISKDKIYLNLRTKGWKRKRILKAFSELKEFVSCFE
jgi:hypothetical protein